MIHQFLHEQFVDITKIAGQFELRLHLIKGPSRISEKVPKLGIGQPSMTFCDIAWHRRSCASNLNEQPEGLRLRQSLTDPIRSSRKGHCLLPNN